MTNINSKSIEEAAKNLEGIAQKTPLQYCARLSEFFGAKIYLKREDLQKVRSYKIRGAYNKISSLDEDEKKNGIVCASAGNHAQGVAFSAAKMKIKGIIFMPTATPLQKINKVKQFGGKWVDIKLTGATFDESCKAAKKFALEHNMAFIPPFDDEKVICGQGTVGKEIFDAFEGNIDIILCPVGGGGLIAGVSTFAKEKRPETEVIGVEPQGAGGMYESLKTGQVVTLDKIDTFVDGAAVKAVGEKTFKIALRNVEEIILVPEGQVCTTMIELYQNEGIITEPAGALTVSALINLTEKIKGKTIVCIISGGNNDILRYPEIMERSLVYQGLKHYFLIEFAQKPGQLRQFVDQALGVNDDIVRFEYIKKTDKERGPALIGVELTKREDYKKLLSRMDKLEIKYTVLKENDLLYSYLI
ncbi:MAG: threonine dehydratase [Armatimonadetes bacterium]|nr:MAG: threonine dehydratase [Armatimonadota bacterium]